MAVGGQKWKEEVSLELEYRFVAELEGSSSVEEGYQTRAERIFEEVQSKEEDERW